MKLQVSSHNDNFVCSTLFLAGPKGAESIEYYRTKQRNSVYSPNSISDLPSPSTKDPPATSGLSSWSSDEQKIREAFHILLPIAHKWENIGTLLDLSPNELSKIKHDVHEADDCLREMIKLWLRRVTIRPTWQSLADAVSVIDEKTASDITFS